ncbi:MAG TPA: serine hydrolase [Mucilaginibacter sp.]|jgi:CubicO group peptidase (beta-lactamase class C family)|nr:serine hydrolase [Mucilaginibacter sp.]
MDSFNCKRITLLLLLFLFKAAFVFPQPTRADKPSGTDSRFSFTAPENEGFSSKGLCNIFSYVKENKVNIHSLLIIRHKRVIFDAYFYPFRPNLRHDIASCTKSITALLTGIAIDKGYIKNEDQLVSGFFPEIKPPSKGFETLTIKDLLTMTSGFDCSFANEDSLFYRLFQSSNWPGFIFNIPFAAEPGKQFSYCSCNYYLLAEIIYRATKLSPEDFAKKYLFNPLGIKSVYWSKNDKGINYGWGDLALKPYDLAKISQLLLDDGKWNGKTVISLNWLKKSEAMNTKFDNGNGYGYGFWLDRDHAYNAEGRGGQRLLIDPVNKTIIVVTAGGYNWDDKGGMGDIIGSAHHFDKKLKNDPLAYKSLRKLENEAARLVNDSSGHVYVSTEKNKLFNKALLFPKNSLSIKSAEIVEQNGKTFFKLIPISGPTISYPLGIGAAYKFYKDPGSGHLFALGGYWKADSEFEIEFNMLSKINKYLVDFKIDNHIRVMIKEGTHEINEEFPVMIEN